MYTQCPECDVAFRVSADVLKQAAGKVRCGGCGIAFNALSYLSEEMPVAVTQVDPDTGEYTLDEPGELEADIPPKSISAEQSAALLKTLDQLAGEDIRIEDTGVEWRVLDDDETDDDDSDEPVASFAPNVAHEEMRFDDNTPLPDDFDLDALSAPASPATVAMPESEPSIEESQVDLVFGEPYEWEDLLGDLEEIAAPSPSLADPILDEMPNRELVENDPVIDFGERRASQPLDMDTQFAIQAEAMGIDLSGMHKQVELAPETEAEEIEAINEELAVETSIDEDLISAAFEVEAAARASAESKFAEELSFDDVAPEDLSRAGILDEDDYLEIITEPEPEAEPEAEADAEPEPEAEESLDELLGASLEDDLEDEFEEEDFEEEGFEEIEVEDFQPAESEEDLSAALESALDDLVDKDELVVDEFAEVNDIGEAATADVPELSVEEMTVNLLIDQELLAIASKDGDGFTSTIVQKQISNAADIPTDFGSQESAEKEAHRDIEEDAAEPEWATDDNPLMETIIMEGDMVHNDEEKARVAADRLAASASVNKLSIAREKDSGRNFEASRTGKIAAAVLLFLVLIVQVIHYSREAFATSATFQQTVAPVYRMVGSPITPAWNVKGWRFEATKGSTDDDDLVLTIYSRIGNKSEQALPYPLVHIALTDRFEEIIGSRVLDPAEYLMADADPRQAVEPGNNFDAVFKIASPSPDATGFKLNVCYRLSSGQLRCAIEDFK